MSCREKLERAQKLFTDEHSSDMIERQVAAIIAICNNNDKGFLLRDLENVHPILTLCCDRIANLNQEAFIEPVCRVLRLCAQPFMVLAVTEDEQCAPALSLLLKSIARALWVNVARVQNTAAEVLMPFVHVADPDLEVEHNPVGARRARLQHRLISDSGIIPLLVSVLRAMRDGAPRQNIILETAVARLLRELSASPQGCEMLAEAGAVEVLIEMLVDDFRDESVACAVQLVWNVLDMCEPMTWEPLVTPNLVSRLNSVFGRVVCDGYRDCDKELRNDILIVATLCTRVPSALAAFAEPIDAHSDGLEGYSLLSLAMSATMYPGLSAHPVLSRGRVASSTTSAVANSAGSQDELEFKKWVFTLVTRTCVESGCLQSILSHKVLEYALGCLAVPSSGSEDSTLGLSQTARRRKAGQGQVPTVQGPATLEGWGAEQTRELQLAVLSMLGELVICCPEDYAAHGGNQATLTFLLLVTHAPEPHREEMYGQATTAGAAIDPTYLDEGGRGGIGSNPSLRAAALNVLLTSCRLPGFQVELGELGAVPVMLTIIQEPIMPAEHGMLGVSVESAVQHRLDALCVLSALCAECELNQRTLSRERGIGTLRSLLVYSDRDPERSEALLISVLDCLWNAVVGSGRNAARFLALDGLSALLMLLEAVPSLLHGQILGCIADVCEHPEAVTELLAWRSDRTGRDAPQLLVALWLEQDALLDIGDERSGVLRNLERPLEGTGVMRQAYSTELGSMLQAVDDAERTAYGARSLNPIREAVSSELEQQDVKAKIFSVFCKCAFKDTNLTKQEKVHLQLIRAYADLRTGAIVEDVVGELDAALVRPITPDAERLEAKMADTRGHIDALVEQQDTLRSEIAREEEADEMTFLESIKMQQEERQKGGLSLRQKVATQSSYMEQRAIVKKMKQEMLAKSMKQAT